MNFGKKQLKSNKHLVMFGLLIIALFLLTSWAAYAQSTPDYGDGEATETAVTDTTDWSTNWSMAGANPQRASWTSEEVRGFLNPVWAKPFEPYISQKVQIIAANNLLYISTAKGLYALDAVTGNTQWIYPTELPLGHSPTIYNGIAYVGGFDHKIHAINALTGEGIWTFEAGAGFHTNPLVVEGKVYAGSRDGYFYAVHIEGPSAGQLAWQYKTDGPILYSAAYDAGTVFFASNDSHAYALDAGTGGLVWKSAKLPGAGFASYWPVVYQDRVIFSGSNNYRFGGQPGPGGLVSIERDEIYGSDSRGTPVGSVGTGSGDWVPGTPTINATAVLQYFASKPWRRTVFVLDRNTGQERETAPVLWTGAQGAGTRYPPVIGVDGVLYQQNSYLADPYIAGGQVAGWQPGNQYISLVSSDWGAVDEPHAAAAGGNLVYWNLCCDRQSGSFDVMLPDTDILDRWNSGDNITGQADKNREWSYFNYDLINKIPNYNVRFYSPHATFTKPYAAFRGPDGGTNGIYGFHGDVNPPIPYNGKVYVHRSNAIIAFDSSGTSPIVHPVEETVPTPNANVTVPSSAELSATLVAEVQKILDAGHLRPGFGNHGIFDLKSRSGCGDNLSDYWQSTADTIVTLINALPYLPPAMQQDVKAYLQNEFNNYPPYDYSHNGWSSGAAREIFDLPPELLSDMASNGPDSQNYTFKNNGGWEDEGVWGRNPYSFYALWKYAEVFGDAAGIYNASKDDLITVMPLPSDTLLLSMPFVHNAYIAGYIGYLELERLAGQPESTSIKNELNRITNLRINNFTKDSAYAEMVSYCRTLNVASNFMYLTPELAQYLHDDVNALNKVTQAVSEYETLAPHWFITFASEGYGENPITTLYDTHGMFMARALILQESSDNLAAYLDIPAYPVGDLFYIDKLVMLLGKPGYGFTMNFPDAIVMEPGTTVASPVEIVYSGGFTQTVTLETAVPTTNMTASFNVPSVSTPGGAVSLIINDGHVPPMQPGQWFTVSITATADAIVQTGSIQVLVGGSRMYLPISFKQ